MADTKLSALAISNPRGTPDRANDVIYVENGGNSYGSTVNNELGITGAPVGTTDSQTITNKTLTSPTIASPILSGTVTGTYTLAGTATFPASVVTLTGSQTLTNKTLTSPTVTTPTITNASITQDAVTGFTTSNTGTVYGVSITAGQFANNAVAPTALATGISYAKFSNPYKFSVYRNAAFTIGTSLAAIVFDTKNFDTGSNFSTTTGLFTAPVAGFYYFAGRSGTSVTSGNEVVATLWKNGAQTADGSRGISTNTQSGLVASSVGHLLQLAINDTVGLAISSNSTIAGQAGPATTYFSGFLMSIT